MQFVEYKKQGPMHIKMAQIFWEKVPSEKLWPQLITLKATGA